MRFALQYYTDGMYINPIYIYLYLHALSTTTMYTACAHNTVRVLIMFFWRSPCELYDVSMRMVRKKTMDRLKTTPTSGAHGSPGPVTAAAWYTPSYNAHRYNMTRAKNKKCITYENKIGIIVITILYRYIYIYPSVWPTRMRIPNKCFIFSLEWPSIFRGVGLYLNTFYSFTYIYKYKAARCICPGKK